ncbi:ADP-ribose pyrophosphatase YjhB (NUDIX family) [Tamaricihabitans halophyticus]|uniref:ADP-ribose pyrophosphatase YjhB (NUDIX family) n=1 Tax=Tamaricihabitans halophyticus TaxID=1262583 RepID=A0A4R2QHH6_9PSEU|nr:NUDIX hydrolase [Tamaricihabitans halophyticus]TCP48617.1 ADP-ribose pyrophosphatase YjhB (NUDIX family) [Tamaricihabitans halophyticus]
MADNPKHSVSVAGIVVDERDRVLVIRRRDNGRWEMPGGVLELDETFEDGLRREVVEETGMNVQVDRLTGIYKNLSRGIVALVFRCSPGDGDIHATPEAREVRWMTAEEASELMDPAFGIRVLDALDGEMHVRAHDGINLLPA